MSRTPIHLQVSFIKDLHDQFGIENFGKILGDEVKFLRCIQAGHREEMLGLEQRILYSKMIDFGGRGVE